MEKRKPRIDETVYRTVFAGIRRIYDLGYYIEVKKDDYS